MPTIPLAGTIAASPWPTFRAARLARPAKVQSLHFCEPRVRFHRPDQIQSKKIGLEHGTRGLFFCFEFGRGERI